MSRCANTENLPHDQIVGSQARKVTETLRMTKDTELSES